MPYQRTCTWPLLTFPSLFFIISMPPSECLINVSAKSQEACPPTCWGLFLAIPAHYATHHGYMTLPGSHLSANPHPLLPATNHDKQLPRQAFSPPLTHTFSTVSVGCNWVFIFILCSGVKLAICTYSFFHWVMCMGRYDILVKSMMVLQLYHSKGGLLLGRDKDR